MSPPRKKAKKEEATAPPPNHSGVIRFEVDDVSRLDEEGRFSPEITVGGVNWRAGVIDGFDLVSERYEISADLICMHEQSTPWSIDVHAEYVLINSDSSKNISEMGDNAYSQQKNGFDTILLSTDEAMDEEEGFIKDDKITVEIRFSISNMKGIILKPQFDFTDLNDPRVDLALVIGGEKIYVSKQILAVHSPVFNAMFYGDFNEKDKKEIELKQVDREEFVEMLHVIYPYSKRIRDDSVEYLLHLGDQFQISCVMERAEKFLIKKSTIIGIEKLRLADKFRLDGLLYSCLDDFRINRHFTTLKNSSLYDDLSDTTKLILFERMIELAE